MKGTHGADAVSLFALQRKGPLGAGPQAGCPCAAFAVAGAAPARGEAADRQQRSPVLCHEAVAIDGSARILDWLEQRHPLQALYPAGAQGQGISGAASVADGMVATRQALDFVAARNVGYLAGDRFSVADLTVASTLAVAVDLPASPMTFPRLHGPAFATFVERFATHAGAAWVRDIYARHRVAARDFDGASSY